MKMPKQSEPVERVSMKIGLPVEKEIGLGDVVKKVTGKLGFKTCGGCEKRAQALNRWVSFTPRSRS